MIKCAWVCLNLSVLKLEILFRSDTDGSDQVGMEAAGGARAHLVMRSCYSTRMHIHSAGAHDAITNDEGQVKQAPLPHSVRVLRPAGCCPLLGPSSSISLSHYAVNLRTSFGAETAARQVALFL